MRDLSNVVLLKDSDDVAEALKKLRCLPAASFGESGGLLTVRRQASTHDLWWIFNPTNRPIATEASLAATGTPYWVDLWSGNMSPVAQWESRGEGITLPIRAAPHQSVAVIFRHEETAPLHVISATAPLVEEGNDLIVMADTPAEVVYSNGVSRTVDSGTHPTSLTLSSWHLHVDELLPDGVRAHDLELAHLADWRQIPELTDAVGSAVYTAVVRLTPNWFGGDRDVVLRVGELQGAMQLMVNDHLVTTQTLGDGEWLVGKWLKPGSNTVAVRVDTTLLNRVVALRDAGDARYQTGPTALSSAASGLLGPVTLLSGARISGPQLTR
jgi:type IV secretory pathway TrbD component